MLAQWTGQRQGDLLALPWSACHRFAFNGFGTPPSTPPYRSACYDLTGWTERIASMKDASSAVAGAANRFAGDPLSQTRP
jgi:hypothetical protein